MTGGRRGWRVLRTGPSPYAPSFGFFRFCLVVRVREDVALELGGLDLGGDLRAFRGPFMSRIFSSAIEASIRASSSS